MTSPLVSWGHDPLLFNLTFLPVTLRWMYAPRSSSTICRPLLVMRPMEASGSVMSATWKVMARVSPPSVVILILFSPLLATVLPLAAR